MISIAPDGPEHNYMVMVIDANEREFFALVSYDEGFVEVSMSRLGNPW